MRAQLEHQPHLKQVHLDQLVQRVEPRLRMVHIAFLHAVEAGDHGRGAHLGIRNQGIGDLGQFCRSGKTRLKLRLAPGDQADPLPDQLVDGHQGLAQPGLGSQSIGQRIVRQPLLPQ